MTVDSSRHNNLGIASGITSQFNKTSVKNFVTEIYDTRSCCRVDSVIHYSLGCNADSKICRARNGPIFRGNCYFTSKLIVNLTDFIGYGNRKRLGVFLQIYVLFCIGVSLLPTVFHITDNLCLCKQLYFFTGSALHQIAGNSALIDVVIVQKK